jgi:hypothetical protein
VRDRIASFHRYASEILLLLKGKPTPLSLTLKMRHPESDMKKIIPLLITLLFLSCTSRDLDPRGKIPPASKINPDSLVNFFRVCEIDIHNAIRVIVDRDIVKNLTHLQRMNYGGRKYYLLERESITAMIKAVTKGLYEDFILINRHGTVVYSMVNDTIFAKRVKTSLADTPLYDCFANTGEDIYIKDITESPILSENPNLFISAPVVKEKSRHGIFILQVDIKKIEDVMSKNTFIIDSRGTYRVSKNREKIFNFFPYFDKLRLGASGYKKASPLTAEGKTYSYYPFTFKNLSWIIISE